MKLRKLFILSFVALTALSLQSCNNKETAGSTDQPDTDSNTAVEGSQQNPFLISSADDLYQLEYEVNGASDTKSGIYFQLTNDIDLGGSSTNQWLPIGESNSFDGHFDGAGYTVSGLYIDKGDAGSIAGLFGKTSSVATVTNLTVAGYVRGNHLIGGVVAQNSGTLTNCSNMCEVVANGYSGGVTGESRAEGNLTNCHNGGRITANGSFIGGIAGCSYQSMSIKNCYNTGEIESLGTGSVAGIVGYNAGAAVAHCFNYGTVSGLGAGVVNGQGENSVITNCYSLEGSFEPWEYNTHEVTRTSAEIADAGFVATMNSSQSPAVWVVGTLHPVLFWQ